jgi:hypothetical protein
MGYHAFAQRFRSMDPLVDWLENDLIELSRTETDDRLRAVQHFLVQLIYELDPKHVRYAPELLQRA